MTGLLTFHYIPPSSPPPKKKQLPQGLQPELLSQTSSKTTNRTGHSCQQSSPFSETQSNHAQEISGESIEGGPRHKCEVVRVRPASSSFHMQNMKTGLRPHFCIPMQQKDPATCSLNSFSADGARGLKSLRKIMHNPTCCTRLNFLPKFRKKANKLLHHIQLKALTSTAMKDLRVLCHSSFSLSLHNTGE